MKMKTSFKLREEEIELNSSKYKTKQRELILNCLKENGGIHMTADDIFYKLNSNNTRVGKTTIYRYINMLETNGDIRKYVADDIACYQYVKEKDSCKNHYHLICNKCAKLFHVESAELDNIEDIMINKYNFKVDSSKLVLYGCCAKCS